MHPRVEYFRIKQVFYDKGELSLVFQNFGFLDGVIYLVQINYQFLNITKI